MSHDSKLHLRIASPCKAPWENMDGDDRVRFCRECSRNVYNLSAMAEPEARRVIAEREGRICVRFYQRRDGTVLTSDCPVGAKRAFLLGAARAGAAVAGVAAGLATLSACNSVEDEASDELIMGEIAFPPDEPLMGKIAPRSDDE
jgi:hypothetical protein